MVRREYSETYLKIREKEIEEKENFRIVTRIDHFLEINKKFFLKYNSDEVKEAIERIKKYRDTVMDKVIKLEKEAIKMQEIFEKYCHHEIVFYEKKFQTGGYEKIECFCPLCRGDILYDDIDDEAVLFDVGYLYYASEPDISPDLYFTLDEIIKNDLDCTEEEFNKIYKELFPKESKHRGKVKIRRKV